MQLPTNQILLGDALEHLQQLPDESIDLVVTDPPYALTSGEYKPDKKYSGGFMNKDWDKAVVSTDVWKECLRVLKSGAFAFVMSAPRQDVLSRMICNLQDAGFRTDFTSIYWTYSSGFPKAANTAKLLKKRGIDKPELEGSYLGFQPKPALEVILVVMKPLSEKTFVDQALKNGKGCTWLDDCKIPFQNESDYVAALNAHRDPGISFKKDGRKNPLATGGSQSDEKGRFPANLLCSDDSLNDGTTHTSGAREQHHNFTADKTKGIYGKFKHNRSYNSKSSGSYSRYFDLDAWYSAQFIITPKASSSERNKGLSDLEPTTVNDGRKTPIDNPFQRGETIRHNSHPTTKPIKLMSYLITMGSRPDNIILDPFIGSGTTAIAAYTLNRKFIGIEKNPEYYEIAQKRIKPYLIQQKLA